MLYLCAEAQSEGCILITIFSPNLLARCLALVEYLQEVLSKYWRSWVVVMDMQREEAIGASLKSQAWGQIMEHLEFESGLGFSF